MLDNLFLFYYISRFLQTVQEYFLSGLVIAQWWTSCLICARACVLPSALQKNNEKGKVNKIIQIPTA
jgi:hypothetical protein